MAFLSCKQQCQSTEGNSQHQLQQGKVTQWPHLFFIHHKIPEEGALYQLSYASNVTCEIVIIMNIQQ